MHATSHRREPLTGLATPAAWLTLAVFTACLIGIYTRPAGLLASVWPANAVMVGLLLRWPATASPTGWIGAAGAFLAADLLTGSSLFRAIVLNTANLVSVGVACAVYARLPPDSARLGRPVAIVHLVLASVIAGAAAGVVGGLSAPLFFQTGMTGAWAFWLATEFVNYVTFLPVILAARMPGAFSFTLPTARPGMAPADVAPIAALLVSCLVALLVGGPGALAVPVPALLWCGLAYALFPTTVLTLLFGVWTLMALAFGSPLDSTTTDSEAATVSARLGVSLVALVPVLIASVMENRDDQLTRVLRLATHDPLTDLVNRGAFREQVEGVLAGRQRTVAMMMIDIDHFKLINDTFGHAGGDAVLAGFAQRVQSCLAAGDVIARLGGDEFAVFAADRTEPDLRAMAGRVQAETTARPFVLHDSRRIPVTASIGMVIFATADRPVSLDHLLADADAALYLAKANGRDRLEVVRIASELKTRADAARART